MLETKQLFVDHAEFHRKAGAYRTGPVREEETETFCPEPQQVFHHLFIFFCGVPSLCPSSHPSTSISR